MSFESSRNRSQKIDFRQVLGFIAESLCFFTISQIHFLSSHIWFWKKRDFLLTPCYNGCVDTKHLCCAGGKGDLRGMEETERRTESITVRLISKEQFCKIMDAIHEQDKLMDSICKSLERIADIFSFDVDNKYRKASLFMFWLFVESVPSLFGGVRLSAHYLFSTPLVHGEDIRHPIGFKFMSSRSRWVCHRLRREVSLCPELIIAYRLLYRVIVI